MPTLAAEKRKWAKALITDPNTPCIECCPYKNLVAYLNKCPKRDEDDIEELQFVRGVTARGDPRFLTKSNLGYNEIMKIPERINQRLSEANRVEKATGKAGRTTYTTLGMNSTGLGPVVIAAATKHDGLCSTR